MKMELVAKAGLNGYQATELGLEWRRLCAANMEHYGRDHGSCVIGAGLSQNGVQFMSTWVATQAQGSCIWERGLPEMLKKFNEKHGTKIQYDAGRLD